jgi:dsDNA-specific endonuclease/ATPase MutS2
MSLNSIINPNSLPTLDLHSETGDVARVLINDFINDNIKLKNQYIFIIHGVGSGVLRKVTHETLKNNKSVIDYKTNYYNNGATLVQISLTLKQN